MRLVLLYHTDTEGNQPPGIMITLEETYLGAIKENADLIERHYYLLRTIELTQRELEIMKFADKIRKDIDEN